MRNAFSRGQASGVSDQVPGQVAAAWSHRGRCRVSGAAESAYLDRLPHSPAAPVIRLGTYILSQRPSNSPRLDLPGRDRGSCWKWGWEYTHPEKGTWGSGQRVRGSNSQWEREAEFQCDQFLSKAGWSPPPHTRMIAKQDHNRLGYKVKNTQSRYHLGAKRKATKTQILPAQCEAVVLTHCP